MSEMVMDNFAESKRLKTFSLAAEYRKNNVLRSLVEVLKQPSESRDYIAKKLLYEYFLPLEFFKSRKVPTLYLKQTVNEFEHMLKPANSYVINFGEDPLLCYIILKGAVSIWIPVPMEDMIKPIQKLKRKVIEQASDIDGADEEDLDFKFHFDPFKEEDLKSANYTTFEDYDNLMDHTLSEEDREFYWQAYTLQRAIDTLGKMEYSIKEFVPKKTPMGGDWFTNL